VAGVEPKSDKSKLPERPGARRQRTVLVVDDDAALRQFVSDALDAEGYRIVQASDGSSALAAVETAKPDLILLDVQMPGIDGWDVLRQLRAKAGPHQPIVVMTGQYTGQERALSTGAQGYLAKPFDLDDLLSCVDLHSGITMETNMTERMATHENGHSQEL
jgi:CheY-like chemotaxis protein